MAGAFENLHRHRGLLAVTLYSFLSAVEFMLVKLLIVPVHPMEVTTIQFASQFLISVPAITFYRISPLPESAPVGVYLILRGTMGIIAVCTIYYAFKFIPVGDAVAIASGAPVFVALFARIFLKESFGIKDLVSVLVAVAGMFLVARPSFLFAGQSTRDPLTVLGILLALASCLVSAGNGVVIRKLGLLGVSNFVVVLYLAIVGTLGTALLSTVLGAWSVPPCGEIRYILVATVLLQASQQNLVTYALAIERAVYVSIIRSIKVVFVFLLELWWFGVIPTWSTLVGTGLVVIATVMMSVSKETGRPGDENPSKRDSSENNELGSVNNVRS